MFYALHDEEGVIRKVLKGPSLEWAQMNDLLDGELIFESEGEIDNATRKIDMKGAVRQPIPYIAPKSIDELQNEIVMGAQRRLDDFARSRNYDSIMSACTYATDPNPTFSAEGQKAVNLRSATWAALYQMLREVQTGARSMPSGFAAIESLLPPLEW
ncbi:MAG: hypothetical protein JWQ74_3582 [Marmoricola sp.]|nr:hypothetical protein [Marmoricola sp.]